VTAAATTVQRKQQQAQLTQRQMYASTWALPCCWLATAKLHSQCSATFYLSSSLAELISG